MRQHILTVGMVLVLVLVGQSPRVVAANDSSGSVTLTASTTVSPSAALPGPGTIAAVGATFGPAAAGTVRTTSFPLPPA